MARPPLTAPILGDPSRSDADPYDLHSDLIREEPDSEDLQNDARLVGRPRRAPPGFQERPNETLRAA